MKPGYFTADIQEFIRLLYKYEVKYLIIGGEAVIYYGHIRVTGDIDFYFKNDDGNTQKLYEALLDFWDHNIPVINSSSELKQPGYVIQFGVPPNRIDLLNEVEGVNFDEAWEAKNTEKIKSGQNVLPIYYIGLKHLIISKEKAGRDKDREDLKYLRQVKE